MFELDATGATRWVFTAPANSLDHVALTPDGQIFLTGGASTPDGSYGFIACRRSRAAGQGGPSR